MSTRLFDIGRQGLADSINWQTDTIKAMLIDKAQADTAIKAITNVTNATPMVATAASHGFQNGDIVCMAGVGGCTAANGTWKAAGVTTNTFQLTTVKDGLNSTGNGAYTSGGAAIDLTLTATIADINAGRVGTDQTLGSKTDTAGVLDAADITFPAFTGNVDWISINKDTGTDATGTPIVFVDGKQQVVVAADASSSATTLWVEPLAGPIASGVVMVMSNGQSVTLSGSAVAGARSLSVNALGGAIAAGHTADVATTGAGLPATLSNSAFAVAWDNGASRIIRI